MNTKISRDGIVTNRATNETIGFVERIQWPTERNGSITTEWVWEARKRHELATVSAFSFPAFRTRREAAQHLAEQAGL